MSTDLTIRPVTGSSLQDVMTLGKVFKASGYFRDIRDEAQAVTKILYGREMGFTPIVSIMGIYIIDGKPSLSANLLATLVKRSGKYDYRVIENTATRCAILFRQRKEGFHMATAADWEDLGTTEFTMEEAKNAGVTGKDNWRKYPKAMLFARALSAGVRAHCPDVSACPLYVPEELGAEVTEEGEVTELPKSKVNAVERTTEDIEIGPVKGNNAAANPRFLENGAVGADESRDSNGQTKTMVGAPVSAEGAPSVTVSTTRQARPASPPATVGEAVQSQPLPAPETYQKCGVAENKSFYAEISKALPAQLKTMTEEWGRAWLKDHKPPYVKMKNGKKEGSLQDVPKLLFPELMVECMADIVKLRATVGSKEDRVPF